MIPKKPKIAFFFNSGKASKIPKLGGAERRLARIFDLLSYEEKVEAHLVLKIAKRNDNINIEPLYRHVLSHNSLKITQFQSFWPMAKYMRRERFDWVCYTDSYRLMVPFMLFGVFFGAKRMMLNVTTTFSELKFGTANRKRLFNLVVRFSSHMDVLYPSGFKRLKQRFPRKPMTLTPGAFTNLDYFKPDNKQRNIVLLGTLGWIKNPELFVKAIVLIKSILIEHNYTAYICGTGDMYDELRCLIDECNSGSIIKMTGQVNPEDYLPTAEVFVSIQSFNNYPSQSLLEAIACGCYIVASDEGDTRLIVKEEFGALCELTAESIAENLKNYIEKSAEEKAQFVDVARAFAVENFTIDKSAQHYEQLFTKGG